MAFSAGSARGGEKKFMKVGEKKICKIVKIWRVNFDYFDYADSESGSVVQKFSQKPI
jgi:hypothetical protein